MNITEAFLYGITQGISEYLPISSSAHLILIPKFLKSEDPGLAFDVFLHIGTLMATLIYFWKDWLNLLWPITKLKVRGTGMNFFNLVLATIPALLMGALFHKITNDYFRTDWVLMITLALGGILLYLADRYSRVDQKLSQASASTFIKVGFYQCLALMSGMSRSGSTIMGARILGLNRESAARLSFMMSAPITLAAIVFEFRHFDQLTQSTQVGWMNLFVAGFSSFVFGILSIGFLIKMLSRLGFMHFMIYRLFMSVIIYFVLIRSF